MKFQSTMLVVGDMERSKRFYERMFGEIVVMDLGENVTLSSGLALQTRTSWAKFLGKQENDIRYGSDNFELYYETDDLDAFLPKLEAEGADLAHPVKEMPWGQRVARFYDPDHHLIEVGESMKVLIQRMFAQGMTPEDVAQRTGLPLSALQKQE